MLSCKIFSIIIKLNMIYKNILITLNLSDNNKLIFEKAIKISQTFKTNINVIYIVNLPSPYITHAFMSNIQKIIITEGKKKLNTYCEYYNIPKNNQHICIGSSIITIIEIAKKINSNLIIMDNNNNYNSLSEYINTTTTTLLNKINCDLLIISNNN